MFLDNPSAARRLAADAPIVLGVVGAATRGVVPAGAAARGSVRR
ncbi:hypothetical protein [Georgenia sp. TF02-10]|nr:hypothetical protein [Georgenia sp. TF02-10]